MKKINTCVVSNCIPTPSSCTIWDGGDVEFLGICDRTPLNTLAWEIINKLKSIAGEDLSSFDMDALVDICTLKAPAEVSLLNILNLMKENQICLKDFTEKLSQQLADLSNTSQVNINLKCYENVDNMGNSLTVTRKELDQLVVDQLCAHSNELNTLAGEITDLRAEIADLDNTKTVQELKFGTCVNASILPTSSQVVFLADAHCALESATGNKTAISQALSKVPSNWNTLYQTTPGWNPTPTNQADVIGNLLLVIGLQGDALKNIQDTCCAPSCDAIKVGFNALVSTDAATLTLQFTSGAGTSIPAGFTDKGSIGTVMDHLGTVQDFTLAIANNATVDVSLANLDLNGILTITITSILSNGTLTCEKMLLKTAKSTACSYCEITAQGSAGSTALITYQ